LWLSRAELMTAKNLGTFLELTLFGLAGMAKMQMKGE
jgi:hypothetical protein